MSAVLLFKSKHEQVSSHVMHVSDASYFHSLFICSKISFVSCQEVPQHFYFSHAFLSVPGEAKGTLFSNKEEKVKQDQVPWESEAKKTGSVGGNWTGKVGELCAKVAQVALPASVCILKPQSWAFLCWVKDKKPFQKGDGACTPACYCALWTHQPKSGLNSTSLHFVLFCSVDMSSVYKCHDSLTKHRRFTPFPLFLCQCSRCISLGSNMYNTERWGFQECNSRHLN